MSADVELSVKNGAELLDRLMKDIVVESASVYIPQYPETARISYQNHYPTLPVSEQPDSYSNGILIPHPSESSPTAFSLAHFIPLLADRIFVVSPFARSFLVSWIMVLDSVPELELVSFLPEFLQGLM